MVFKRWGLLLLFLLPSAYSKTIIWDLGDTLFRSSRIKIAYHIGFSYFFFYALMDLKNPNIKPILFDILEKMNPSDLDPVEVATDNEGTPMPILMNEWLAGVITGKELLKSIYEYLDLLDEQKYFVSFRQKRLIKRTLTAMFDGETLANATEPIMEGIKLLEECHDAVDDNGKPKNTLLVLSNWDEASFELVRQRHLCIFEKYFESKHIVISGAIGLIKPRKEAFEYVINTYGLDPKDCVFIDDQRDNIVAAESVGITGLRIAKGHHTYKTLRKKLKELGAL